MRAEAEISLSLGCSCHRVEWRPLDPLFRRNQSCAVIENKKSLLSDLLAMPVYTAEPLNTFSYLDLEFASSGTLILEHIHASESAAENTNII